MRSTLRLAMHRAGRGSLLVEQATRVGESADPVTLTWNHRALQPLTLTSHFKMTQLHCSWNEP